MSDEQELLAIHERYQRRQVIAAQRYSHFNPGAMLRLLSGVGIQTFAGLDILEIGCSSGGAPIKLVELGTDPARLVGNELRVERLERARERLPAAVRLHAGDANALPFEEALFDIVLQSTVFSSILDAGMRQRLAASMWRWVRPSGGIPWYDFTYNNPSNKDVVSVKLRAIHELFPQAKITVRRVTLAPPISRRACRLHPALYHLFNAIPLLRTHVLCWIEKKE